MRIETNMADQRKLLAQAISEWIHEPVHYEGVPSCAYTIGTVKVERGGIITSDDSEAWTALQPFFQNHGWAEEIAAEEPADLEAPAEETPIEDDLPKTVEFSVPAGDITMDALKNLIFMLSSKQYLLNRAAGVNFLRIPEALIEKLKEYRPKDFEDFAALLAGFEEADGLQGFKIIGNKLALVFPFDSIQPDRWTVYANLFARAVTAAKCASRVKPEMQMPESEKYAMRSWLLRLGYGEDNLKDERRELMKNLTGFAAFRNGAEAQKHKDKYAAVRRENRQINTESEVDAE